MELGLQAAALEQACDAFLELRQDVKPSVALRNMRPVLEALHGLVRATEQPVTIQTIFQYPLLKGARAKGNEADAMAVVGYKLDTSEFVWRVLPVAMTPAGMAFLAIMDARGPNYRVVSMEDLVELGIAPTEIVDFIKTMAGQVTLDQMKTSFTQKPASA